MTNTKLTLLAGGVGAAKFAPGLSGVVDPRNISLIANTADDIELHGLYISPDVDTLVYTLAGLADPDRGWGIRGDTFRTLESLRQLGQDAWFQLGDQDIATHLVRTELKRQGLTPTAITRFLTEKMNVKETILPMSDEPVCTYVLTDQGWMHFQEFFVRNRCAPEIRDLTYRGIESARPTQEVLNALNDTGMIVICPSNPLASIGPILALPGVRQALAARRCPAVAISPIVGGRALKGPADRMLRAKGFSADILGVAGFYEGLIDGLVIDRVDAPMEQKARKLGIQILVTETVMKTSQSAAGLARELIQWAEETFHDQYRHSSQEPVHC